MLNDLLTRASLENLAGSAAFQRGEEYFSADLVGRLRATGDKLTAEVEGSKTYRVELREDQGELAHHCSCPRAADGYFCKHCVAVGLAWLAEQPSEGKSAAKPAKTKRRDPWLGIKEHLSTQSPETLVELLLDVAQRDDRLYRSLLLKGERTGGGGKVVKAYRRAIDSATRIRDFIDWRAAGSFAGGIEQVVDSMRELLSPDTAATLVELAEYAIERVEKSLEQVDDSNGEVGEIVYRLGELHLKACAMARPEPAGLAERLFRIEMTLPFGVCSFDANTYREPLGKAGLQRYRELAEAEWRKVKPKHGKENYDAERWRITGIMEKLAQASGDVEELVAIKSRDLSSAYCYLQIAEILAEAKQADKALAWAERGLKAFPERPDNRLRDFLVAAYLKRKRHDEALQLTWIQFEEQPGLEPFKKLHGVAGKLGVWPAQRSRALAKLAEVIASKGAATTRWKPKPSTPDYSQRVAIALWEKDMDSAWAAAHEGACDRNMLIALAEELEASRADDAISLYRRVVPPIVEQTNNAAYQEAIKLIGKVGGMMKAHNQSRQFGDYLAELAVQFKPKRNFIKLLDGVARSAAK